jgi:glycosyltransferase involved in cell wall biosynthesis
MPNYIAIADICLNVWPINARTENIFSAKIIQYLSCGKPVLSSALNGITRALPESETGVTYFDDIQTLVEKLEQLSTKPDLVKQLGTLGRKYIEKNHSVKQIGLSVEKHLLELIHER